MGLGIGKTAHVRGETVCVRVGRDRLAVVARVIRPGFAFAVVSDLGFVVGLHTHRNEFMGYLIWLSQRTFDEMPTIDDARAITEWRWCVFYPLGAAINRQIDIPIGNIPIPSDLQGFPRMRSGGGPQPWFEHDEGELRGLGRPTQDRALPIVQAVNDTRLKEMITTGWRPDQRW